MDLGIRGLTAVVTGGASGIGAAVVEALQAEGALPVCWDLVKPNSCSAAAVAIEADITSLSSVQDAWEQTELSVGPPEILVHCAAVGSGHYGFPYTNVPPSAWEKVLTVNVLGMANVADVAGRAMAGRRRGSMVFLASVAGQMGSPTDPPYSASKAANINFAQVLAKDLAPCGVRVNTVCPGMVQTPLNKAVWESWNRQQPSELQQSYEDWAAEKIRRVVPLGRWQQPADIAAMIVFLCSPRAGEVTGQTINVDGGCVMHW
ncbi:MAG: 3-oxoacyl-[acyl-carrier-protein] reductase FabG [Planctomycetota bacterium]|jgi:2-hydroxycyclohexanecarboxyl-CoA dehydrogenase